MTGIRCRRCWSRTWIKGWKWGRWRRTRATTTGRTTLRLLRVKGVHSAIRVNEYRTQKKDKNKEIWLALRATPEYQRGGRERYKIELKFGEGRQGHGLGRCRSLGVVRYAIQAFLTVLSLNLKRMVKALTGVNVNGRASAAG